MAANKPQQQVDLLVRIVAPADVPKEEIAIVARRWLQQMGLPVYVSIAYVGTDRTDDDQVH